MHDGRRMPATPDDFARELADLAHRFGPDGLNDRKRVVALLADRLTDAARDVRIVGVAIDNGAVVALRATAIDGIGVEIDRLAARIENHIGTPKALTLPILRALAYGLGRGALPSAYAPAATASLPVSPPPPAAPVPPPPVPAPDAAPTVRPAPAPPQAVTPAAAAMSPMLVALAAYAVVALLYWLWMLIRYATSIPYALDQAGLDEFTIVVMPVVMLPLGLAAAWSFLRRHRSFAALLSGWLLLAALVTGYAPLTQGNFFYFFLELDGWEGWLPPFVSFVAALLFVPYVWRSPRVRARFVR
jgi:hypothetical protein